MYNIYIYVYTYIMIVLKLWNGLIVHIGVGTHTRPSLGCKFFSLPLVLRLYKVSYATEDIQQQFYQLE